MNLILKKLLLGFCAPALLVCGAPQKWKTETFHREKPMPLRFGPDGKFRILHLTDIHLIDPAMEKDDSTEYANEKEAETLHCMEYCLEMSKPDLVVFGGDNISGYRDDFTYGTIADCITHILEPISRRKLPLAVVFGNHDAEAGFHAEFQMLLYMEYPNCRAVLNEEDVYGCGNYSLPIFGSDGKKAAFNLWFMDSNQYEFKADSSQGYDHVHADQIAWYEKKAARFKAENGGKPLPAILFQHMPVLQELDLLRETNKNGENVIESNGKFVSFGDRLLSGRLRERPCPPDPELGHREELEAWKRAGDIRAAFFGHDHVNDFTVEWEGIRLIQTLGSGYFTYGKERGGRLIVLDENDPDQLMTETIEVPRITDVSFR